VPGTERLTELTRPIVEAIGLELVDVEVQPGSRRVRLRVTIDRPTGVGNVSLDDCTNVSRRLDALLDVEDVMPNAYVLEVSSPGMNRPLLRRSDYERFAGVHARLRLKDDGGAPRQTLVGVIGTTTDEGVELIVPRKGGASEGVRIPIDRVERATLDPTLEEWNRLGQAQGGEAIEWKDGEETP